MKMVAAFILAMISYASVAADREVRIFVQSNTPVVTGDTLPAKALTLILFVQESCSLDIADKRGYYRAWQASGAYQLGCWYPIRGDTFVFIGAIGSLTYHSEAFWPTFPRAKLHLDGSATITQANYNSDTFLKAYLGKRVQHMFDHARDKP